MMNKRRIFWALLVIALVVVGLGQSLAQEIPPEQPAQKAQVMEDQGKIIPSPKDIKERTAIYVFIGWMWLSITVLIFILRAKIKETDRLYHLRFFSQKKE